MPIVTVSREEWAGAASCIIAPVGADVCPLYPSFNALVLQEHAAGRGVTVRAGVGFAKRTVAEITASCQAVTPNPTGSVPLDLSPGTVAYITGTGFADVVGQLHLGNASTWAASTVKVLQPVGAWIPTSVEITSVTADGLVDIVWVYVLNKYGLRNEAGLQRVLGPVE